MKSPSPSFPLRAFTLTEMAIVMVVAGVIMGGVWASVGSVSEKIKQDKMQRVLVHTVSNLRAAYGGRAFIQGGISDLATLTIGTSTYTYNNIYPADVLRGSGSNYVANTPWGGRKGTGPKGTLNICAWLYYTSGNADTACKTTDASLTKTPYFAVEMAELTGESCMGLAERLTGPGAPDGLVDVYINGTSVTAQGFPLTPAGVRAQCLAYPSNDQKQATFSLVYRLTMQPM